MGSYRVQIGSQQLDLPLIELSPSVTIALLMTIDRGVAFAEQAGADLADLLRPEQPEVVATAATLGIPVALTASRALGLDDYLVLQKTPKTHLGDALAEPLSSITTGSPQRLLLDRRRIPLVAGRRVAFIDDVVATGGSLAAALRLLRLAGAEVVGVATCLAEGSGWRHTLGADADLVRSLGRIPVFHPDGSGGLKEDWDG